MMGQVLFVSLLYLVGSLFLLAYFGNQMDRAFLYVIAFPIGMLLWVIVGMTILVFGLPYTALTMFGASAIISAFLIVICLTRKRLNMREGTCFFRFFCLLLFTTSICFFYNLTPFTHDSFILVDSGRFIALDHVLRGELEGGPGSYGIFIPLLQSAAGFLNIDYLWVIQPALGLCFICTYYILLRKSVEAIGVEGKASRALVILSTLALISAPFFLFQIFYIHTNLSASYFLFLALSSFWLGLVRKEEESLTLSLIALLGFALQRTETPLIALIFLLLMYSESQLSEAWWRARIVPLVAFLTIWHIRILQLVFFDKADVLTPSRVIFLIALLVSIALIVSRPLPHTIRRHLHLFPTLLIGCLSVVLIAQFISKPDEMLISVEALFSVMFLRTYWGFSWVAIMLLVLFSFLAPKIPFQRIFSVGTITAFVMIVALSFFRGTYHTGWGDSGNRMLTHVLPIAFYFLSVKTFSRSVTQTPRSLGYSVTPEA